MGDVWEIYVGDIWEIHGRYGTCAAPQSEEWTARMARKKDASNVSFGIAAQ